MRLSKGTVAYAQAIEATRLLESAGYDRNGRIIPPPKPRSPKPARKVQPPRIQAVHNADTRWLADWAAEADKAAEAAKMQARLDTARRLRDE